MPGASEADIRRELIDPALEAAGWDVEDYTRVGIEIPADKYDPAAWKALQPKLKAIAKSEGLDGIDLPAGICDYVLYQPNGEIIAVVEAKKSSINPRLARAQAEFYVKQIAERQSFRPFAFTTNGHEIYFWDVGTENPRLVHGFFTLDDLQRRRRIRDDGKALSTISIQEDITDRLYQKEAIRRISEAFDEEKRRKALLVMATGTGKTRTIMSLVDIFMRAGRAQHILFVADRDALVKQALNENFKVFLPEEPAVRIRTSDIDKTKRLYVSTLQTLSNCFEEFSPAFFDLIIFDEVHRSIFNKWNEVVEYFDGHMIGLTATPARYIDRNTFRVFECFDETPTYLYSYKEAVEEGYLVDYALFEAQTRFQRHGIKGVDLSEEERNQLIESGIDPDEIDYEGTDIERTVTNTDTLRQQWEEFMEVCYRDESSQYPGKTIVFAMTQAHADRLAQAFEEMYPGYSELLRVITYKSNYKDQIIKQFKKESMPRIALSVDMLDTGIDVPEVVNLVFMKPVHSYIKLHQMLGRGTRPQATVRHDDWVPNGHKEGFLIIDFWENEFTKDPEADLEQQNLPVLVTIFNTRLKILEHFLPDRQDPAFGQAVADLRDQVNTIPTDAFNVKRVMPDIGHVWEDHFWRHITANKLQYLRVHVGPLLRFVPNVDVEAATFTSKVERLKYQILTGNTPTATAESIMEDVSRLPNFVAQAPARKDAIDHVLSPEFVESTPEELTSIINALADQMKNRREREAGGPQELDLKDIIEARTYVFLREQGQPIYVDEYRRRVNDRILDVIIEHPAIAAIEAGEEVSDEQLLDLERALREDLGEGQLKLTPDKIRRAYGVKVDSFMAFVRHLLELDGIPDYGDIIRRKFEEFAYQHDFNGDQLNFLRTLRNVFLKRRHLESVDLYDAPAIKQFGMNAADRLFSEAQLNEILTFTETLEV